MSSDRLEKKKFFYDFAAAPGKERKNPPLFFVRNNDPAVKGNFPAVIIMLHQLPDRFRPRFLMVEIGIDGPGIRRKRGLLFQVDESAPHSGIETADRFEYLF